MAVPLIHRNDLRLCPQAIDMDLAKQLWGRSEELLENFSR